MATSAYTDALLGGVDAALRRALKAVFDYVLRNLRFGRPEHQTPTENFQLYYVTGRTATVADTEFSIAHGLGQAPYLAIPVLDLQSVGASTVPLEVSRAADGVRIYLKSSEADAPITLLVEAAS
jgi:hypothetical protein